jgi:hypothetical protein
MMIELTGNYSSRSDAITLLEELPGGHPDPGEHVVVDCQKYSLTGNRFIEQLLEQLLDFYRVASVTFVNCSRPMADMLTRIMLDKGYKDTQVQYTLLPLSNIRPFKDGVPGPVTYVTTPGVASGCGSV